MIVEITECGEDGVRVLEAGASSCHLDRAPEGHWSVSFHKGTVELGHLRIEGLDEAEARRRARLWLAGQAAAADHYQGRRTVRVQGLEGAARRRRAGAESAADRATAISARFEGGQPILAGHYSEAGARCAQGRMHAAMSKSVALSREADELLVRARAAASNQAVSSDDPDSIAKVCARLEAELEDHALLLRVRKATAKARKAGDLRAEAAVLQDPALGLTREQSLRFARAPVEPYMLTNSSGRIRATRERLEALLVLAARVPPAPEEIGDATIFEEENRVRLRFARRAPDLVRAFLERNGFHWSRTVDAWQRMPGTHPGVVWELARDAARMAAET